MSNWPDNNQPQQPAPQWGQAAPPPPGWPQQPMQYHGGGPAPVPPKGNRNGKVLAALGAVVVGVLMGTVGYLVTRGDDTEADGPTPTTEAAEPSEPRPTRPPTTEPPTKPTATEAPTTQPPTTNPAPTTPATTKPAPTVPPATKPPTTKPPGTETTTAPAGDGSTSIEGAILWTSTDGKASMEISPDWTEMSVPGTVITWSINNPDVPEGNLNILTTPVAGATAQDFIDATESQLGTLGDIKVIDSGVTTAADGSEIGYIETQGEVSTAPGMDLHFYMVFNIANDQLAQATFTATDEHWAGVIDSVRPYMETIKAL